MHIIEGMMKMTKKKIIYIVLSLVILICIATIVFIKLFVLAPPKVTITKIEICQEAAMGRETEEERLKFLKGMYDESKNAYSDDMGEFWQGDPPTYENIEDYLYIAYTIKVDNPTFVKSSSYSPAFYVEDIDLSENFFITNDLQISGFYIDRRSEAEVSFCFWAYKKGFSKERIEEFVHSVVLKLNYYNRFQKNQSVKIDSKDADIEFIDVDF